MAPEVCHLEFRSYFTSLTMIVLLRSAVTDGVTIGHPCCAVPDCKEDLSNMKSRYCIGHQQQELKCAIIRCLDNTSPGRRTCTGQECRELERLHYAQGTGMFQCKRRLAGLRLPHQEYDVTPVDPALSALFPDYQREVDGTVTEVVDEIDEAVELEIECEDRGLGRKTTLKAQFGRSRTYCEVACVLSCGTIIGRGTMHRSEAPNGIIVSVILPDQHGSWISGT